MALSLKPPDKLAPIAPLAPEASAMTAFDPSTAALFKGLLDGFSKVVQSNVAMVNIVQEGQVTMVNTIKEGQAETRKMFSNMFSLFKNSGQGMRYAPRQVEEEAQDADEEGKKTKKRGHKRKTPCPGPSVDLEKPAGKKKGKNVTKAQAKADDVEDEEEEDDEMMANEQDKSKKVKKPQKGKKKTKDEGKIDDPLASLAALPPSSSSSSSSSTHKTKVKNKKKKKTARALQYDDDDAGQDLEDLEEPQEEKEEEDEKEEEEIEEEEEDEEVIESGSLEDEAGEMRSVCLTDAVFSKFVAETIEDRKVGVFFKHLHSLSFIEMWAPAEWLSAGPDMQFKEVALDKWVPWSRCAFYGRSHSMPKDPRCRMWVVMHRVNNKWRKLLYNAKKAGKSDEYLLRFARCVMILFQRAPDDDEATDELVVSKKSKEACETGLAYSLYTILSLAPQLKKKVIAVLASQLPRADDIVEDIMNLLPVLE